LVRAKSGIGRLYGVQEVAEGIRRVTFRLPLGIDHVHCYLVRSRERSYTLVDTGLGLPDPEARWAPVLGELDGPVERIVITHFHPDHVGDSANVAALTGAPVLQGRLDAEQCRRVWGAERDVSRYVAHALRHGMPAEDVDDLRGESDVLAQLVGTVDDPEPLEPGDSLDGWEVVHLPGHADGHLALLREGVLLAGDAILAGISPVVGVYPDRNPDPLGDYLRTLVRIEELAPRVAYTGHNEPVGDPAGRARELAQHHWRRLHKAERALGDEPRSGYEVSATLFPDLPPPLRRFALAEALAHLERLVREERADRVDVDGRVLYRRSTTAASA
jgi:glyoxylase-like metal-dependent hydrolase (beta-lactamase superfamily II)